MSQTGTSLTPKTASEMDVEQSESGSEPKSAMHTWRYRHHFTYKADQGKNIIVQCNLCLPRVNLLSTSKTSTSNLKKHLDVSLIKRFVGHDLASLAVEAVH